MENKKIAIFHNYMDNIGGAEIVCLILSRELNADIYTTNIDNEKIKKMGFGDLLDRIYSIGKIPINPPYKQQAAYWKFKKLNLGNKYDFYIIGGDWAMSAAINNKPNLWYVYSPQRELWDLRDYSKKKYVGWYKKPFFEIWTWYHRKESLKNLKHVDKIISISKNVQKRVEKFLHRNSVVVYPPTEIDNFYYGHSVGYWLSVNRLINHKRVEIQIEAFRKLPHEKLVVVGSYEKAKHFRKYANYLKKIKPSNVEILNWVDHETLQKLYSNCKGFITTSLDEDYGMTVVEAMASGKPVIAPNEGGYKETVVNGENGVLIDGINVDKLVKAVKNISENFLRYKEANRKRAEMFNTKNFVWRLKEVLKC